MKTDILSKMEELLQAENPMEVAKGFRELKHSYLDLQKKDNKELNKNDENPAEGSKSEERTGELATDSFIEDGAIDQHKEGPEDAVSSIGNITLQAEAEAAAEEKDANASEQDGDELPNANQNDLTDKEEEENPDPEDIRFNAIVEEFNKKFQEAKNKQQAEFAENLKIKKGILSELENLIQEEENIGRAFARFNELRDKWRESGAVENEEYRELQTDYNRLVELFFYNINIYKELKEHDLKKNLEEKKVIIQDQENLLQEKDIHKLELNVKLNQERWSDVGPTFKEEWNELKEQFWNATRNVYKIINDHYEKRKEALELNIEARKKLIEKAKHIAGLQLKAHGKWQEKKKEVIELQKEWESIGFVPRETGEQLWQEFRGYCDAFFENKRKHYEDLRSVQEANKEAKQKLLDLAESLKDSTDWKETGNELIRIQKEWKKIGAAHQRDENKMWRKFREACDHFFNAKKEHFSGQNEREKENLKKKEELLKTIQEFEVTGNKINDIEQLKKFSDEWREIGFVPFSDKDKIHKAYEAVMNEKYSLLKVDSQEKQKIQFTDRIENLKNDRRAQNLLSRERDVLQGKISKLQAEIIQYENNLGFFANSKGADKMIKEVEKKIENVREKIESLKEQIKLINEVEL